MRAGTPLMRQSHVQTIRYSRDVTGAIAETLSILKAGRLTQMRKPAPFPHECAGPFNTAVTPERYLHRCHCVLIATFSKFLGAAILRAGSLIECGGSTNRGLIMNFSSSSCTQGTSARESIKVKDEIRALVARHLDVDIKRVTDEAHFDDDLGADWLDRLELLIVIEDEIAGVEILDDDADQIETVGDLIRYIEDVRSMTGRPCAFAA